MRIKKPRLTLQTTITLLVCGVVAISLLVTDVLISAKISSNAEKNLSNKASYIARMAASSPTIIESLSDKKNEKIIQELANKIRKSTDVEFVVVTDMKGIRKSHPDINQLGKHFVGGDDVEVLKGHEYVSTAEGTLGKSLRAFVPIFTADGKQVGMVCVGISLNTVQQAVSQSRMIIYLGIGIGFIVGVIGAMLLAKSIKKTMFGLEPWKIAKLLEEQNAMLYSIREGVITVDENCRITLVNEEAARIFNKAGITNLIGEKAEDCVPNTRLNHILKTGQPEFDQVQDLRGIKILTNRMPILVNKKIVGAISTFRDKTEMKVLAEQLTGVKQYAGALRAQTHEFMNKLHVILGMLHMKCYDELTNYINGIANKYQEEIGFIVRHVKDPVLAGFILGKMSYAREINVKLKVCEDCFIPEPENPELTHEVVTILGNLLENAVEAVKDSKEKIINLTLLYEKETLTIEVNDSGSGIDEDTKEKLFIKGYSTKGNDRGLGLYLVQKSVERLGGEIEIYSELGKGTLFSIYIPYKSKERMVND
ncbi:two-component system sensor histidine kinase DcuS [Clostridium autoethanogenum]|uniref:histidine kinase n=2 Tax=Clostridium TaxID=1485 RepID=D8GUJ6_CLOLD|nr:MULTISPECIES: DcuS/MalK family sensor histidine kinase [Clostridium]ADK16873.1 predicted sensor histidine kinase [Clostridium ljungdahlii DSM 13528]OAA85581.1 Sensor histidine kinase DcuS [Clostridium ljungdahlii DSM 13528]RMC98831.1 two-component system sensor histidine kinase DcuS [Clostridium autoethanogenum]